MRPRARTTNEEHVVRAGLGDEKIARIDSIGVVVPRRARWPGLEMHEPRTPRRYITLEWIFLRSLARSAAMAMRACAKHEENLDGIELESPRAFQFPRLIEPETLRQACSIGETVRRPTTWLAATCEAFVVGEWSN